MKALVRSRNHETARLEASGVALHEVDFNSVESLRKACEGGSCVVSALSGLRDVIVEAQTRLVDAAIEAKVPRFIPSDFAIDFTKLPKGRNRNLDFRREFRERLETKKISATSILNGAFMELLNGQAPFLVFPIRRAVYFGDGDKPMDFTAMDDVAKFTAAAALDAKTPRDLRIAGQSVTPAELAQIATQVTGQPFKTLRAGGLRRMNALIFITRKLARGENEVFPPWQGMQYSRDMFDGRGRLTPLDNDRYPYVRFTQIREMLERRAQS